MNKEQRANLGEKVMEEIGRRGVAMRPRIYFVILASLLGIGVAGAFMAALLFAVRLTVQLNLFVPFHFLSFGGPGFRPFLFNFPWVSLLVAIGGLGSGLYLLRKYDFSYRRNFLPWVVGAVALLLVAGAVMGQAVWQAKWHETHMVAPLLHGMSWKNSPGIVGRVVETGAGFAVIETPQRGLVKLVGSDDLLGGDDARLEVGEIVHAIGEQKGEEFEVRAWLQGRRGRHHMRMNKRGDVFEIFSPQGR